jgi:protein-tyrosine-phosphatase
MEAFYVDNDEIQNRNSTIMYSVLFVCTANVCRSPMAMALLESKVKAQKDQWLIKSAGVWAMPGYPVAENTRLLMSEIGVDLSDYVSRPITPELIADFNLILVMERGQKEALKAAFPEYTSRIFLMSEMIGENIDVIDPIGRPMVDFKETAREIHRVLTQGFDKIKKLASDQTAESG